MNHYSQTISKALTNNEKGDETIMKKGRYNILLPNGNIKKYNVYMNDYGKLFIFYKRKYQRIKKHSRYKGGWLYELRSDG